MTLSELTSKYIDSAEYVFARMQLAGGPVILNVTNISDLVDFAKAYLDDAKYYREKKKFDVSLASIAYCEGLLDALRMLGGVNFEWPTKRKGRKLRER